MLLLLTHALTNDNSLSSCSVRNPLSAAISACSFVSATLDSENGGLDAPDTKSAMQEDVGVIQSSLTYVNDLLRNMLDMHKASSDQLRVELLPANLRKDVFEPVATMLYQREDNFSVEIECPENLTICSDRIRLKQIVLNLASNSTKFVSQGYIRLRAVVTDDNKVSIFIEDSGPGIPKEKRGSLFQKYQSSLDRLQQGTGIGLSLCKDLTSLLGGTIALDEDYDSGVPGFPGTRFVINLDTKPLLDTEERGGSTVGVGSSLSHTGSSHVELPKQFKVLVVDDDVSIHSTTFIMMRFKPQGSFANTRHMCYLRRFFFSHHRPSFESSLSDLSNVSLPTGRFKRQPMGRPPFALWERIPKSPLTQYLWTFTWHRFRSSCLDQKPPEPYGRKDSKD
jgi:hypothetical protein